MFKQGITKVCERVDHCIEREGDGDVDGDDVGDDGSPGGIPVPPEEMGTETPSFLFFLCLLSVFSSSRGREPPPPRAPPAKLDIGIFCLSLCVEISEVSPFYRHTEIHKSENMKILWQFHNFQGKLLSKR